MDRSLLLLRAQPYSAPLRRALVHDGRDGTGGEPAVAWRLHRGYTAATWRLHDGGPSAARWGRGSRPRAEFIGSPPPPALAPSARRDNGGGGGYQRDTTCVSVCRGGVGSSPPTRDVITTHESESARRGLDDVWHDTCVSSWCRHLFGCDARHRRRSLGARHARAAVVRRVRARRMVLHAG